MAAAATATKADDEPPFDMGELFDLTPTPTLVISPLHRVIRASESLLRAWFTTKEDVVSRDVLEILRGRIPGALPAEENHEDAIAFSRLLRQATSTRVVQTSRVNLHGWRSVRVTPVFRQDHLLAIIIEWSEDTPNPASLESYSSTLTRGEALKLLGEQATNHAVSLLDTEGGIQVLVAGHQLHLGYSEAEIRGKSYTTFFNRNEDARTETKDALSRALSEGKWQTNAWFYRCDNTRLWARVCVTPVRETSGGRHIGFALTMHDVSVDEARRLLVHELRGPLKSIVGLTKMLSEDASLPPLYKPLTNVISQCADNAMLVVDEYAYGKEGKPPRVQMQEAIPPPPPPPLPPPFAESRNGLAQNGTVMRIPQMQAVSPTAATAGSISAWPPTATGLQDPKPAEEARKHQWEDQLSETKARVAGRRILVAEDNLINQRIVKKLLEKLGVTDVTLVGDGAQAVDELIITSPVPHTSLINPGGRLLLHDPNSAAPSLNPRGYSLIFMDECMPVMDGREATRRLRAAGLALPIVGLCVTGQADRHRPWFEEGINGVCGKPLQLKTLSRALLDFLPPVEETPVRRPPVMRSVL